ESSQVTLQMNPERWQQIDELFQATRQHSHESRVTFLVEACDGDEALRREVQQLLVAFDAAGGFLETPAGESYGFNGKPAHGPSLTAGQELAHYRIISQIGVGGMGEVYLANDLKLNSRVAIKILPSQ